MIRYFLYPNTEDLLKPRTGNAEWLLYVNSLHTGWGKDFNIDKCYFDKIVTTNLCYQPPMLREKPYYVEADMSKFIASIIDFMNHDASMANIYTPTDKIHRILAKYNNREMSSLDI